MRCGAVRCGAVRCGQKRHAGSVRSHGMHLRRPMPQRAPTPTPGATGATGGSTPSASASPRRPCAHQSTSARVRARFRPPAPPVRPQPGLPELVLAAHACSCQAVCVAAACTEQRRLACAHAHAPAAPLRQLKLKLCEQITDRGAAALRGYSDHSRGGGYCAYSPPSWSHWR